LVHSALESRLHSIALKRKKSKSRRERNRKKKKQKKKEVEPLEKIHKKKILFELPSGWLGRPVRFS